MYSPLLNAEDAEDAETATRQSYKDVILSLSFTKVARVTVLLPLTGFCCCVVLSLVKDFAAANLTHCNVWNLLPSVSAAIGSFQPQSSIWRLTISLHSPARLFIALLYYKYYTNIIRRDLFFLVFFVCVLNVVEILSLIGLSFWSSSENYPVHKTCFMTFIATSELYMLLSCVLLQRYRRSFPSKLEQLSLKVKRRMLMVNVTSFVAAGYFFMRHNSYCEPFVYTFFAIAEYIVILTNMGFHMTSCYDFLGREILVRKIGITVS